MPWRLQAADDYARYAVRCRDCGRLRGWPTKATVRRHGEALKAEGWETSGWSLDEYDLGDDGTCTCELLLTRPEAP